MSTFPKNDLTLLVKCAFWSSLFWSSLCSTCKHNDLGAQRLQQKLCFCDEAESRSLILLITHVQLTARWRCWLKMPQKWERRSSAGGVCGWFSGQVFVNTLCCVFIFSFHFTKAEFMHYVLEAVNKESLGIRQHALSFAIYLQINLSMSNKPKDESTWCGWNML